MSSTRPPVTIIVAAALAAAEAAALIVLAILQFVSLGDGGTGVAVAWAVFFLLCAVGLGWCARGLLLLDSWARAPIVLAQLIMLGLAWDGRHRVGLAIVLAVVAIAALVAVFHPASLNALENDDQD
ncbi:hypothetical protein AB3X52_17835 [Nocardioides sp. DS6]|uniref:DUF2568 domain-containing protein n=1 Tax=Nocardioides eburneus TaxID=3231482 RepID=A0ABV3T498_9ACTN